MARFPRYAGSCRVFWALPEPLSLGPGWLLLAESPAE